MHNDPNRTAQSIRFGLLMQIGEVLTILGPNGLKAAVINFESRKLKKLLFRGAVYTIA